MPSRATWHHRLAALVTLLAGFVPISDALDQWRRGANVLINSFPQPSPRDLKAALTQCATGTGGATAPTAATIALDVSPASTPTTLAPGVTR